MMVLYRYTQLRPPSEQDDLASSTARWKIWKNTAHLRRKVAICASRVCLVDLGSIGQRRRDENSAPVAHFRLERRAAVLSRAVRQSLRNQLEPIRG